MTLCSKYAIELGYEKFEVYSEYRQGTCVVSLVVNGEASYLSPGQARELADKLPEMLRSVSAVVSEINEVPQS